MKPILILAVTLAAPVILRAAAESDQDAILKAENDWAAAYIRNDADAVARVCASDYTTVMASGVSTLQETIKGMRNSSAKVTSIHVDEMKVRLYGDAAVVIGLETEQSHVKGRDTSGQYR